MILSRNMNLLHIYNDFIPITLSHIYNDGQGSVCYSVLAKYARVTYCWKLVSVKHHRYFHFPWDVLVIESSSSPSDVVLTW